MNNFSQEVFDLIDDLEFGDVDDNDYSWPPSRGPGGPGGRMGIPNNDRYNNAYGSYRGGYGPGGGFGPRMGPQGPPCPPSLFDSPSPRPFGTPGPRGPLGPPGPLRPMVMLGRGFGPEGPPLVRNLSPDVRAFRYQLRCGVAKEVVRHLPKQMLVLMEPEYCGLCGMEFDSFATSRMHYTSRNHTKNQKKWMSQNTEYGGGGGGGSREIPLKSRDLYCELCDVHITSKSHAESHYAGKPHRAIVFGRKKPKNPYLLQRGLESRAEQLIRREKKHVKPMDTEAEEEASNEVKHVQPELYCDICKTSVTCSEQMTMHLNGKRHLTKEKQHIIRVMNQGVTNDNGIKEEAAEVPAEEESSENKTAVNKDDGDWGNGSGTWE